MSKSRNFNEGKPKPTRILKDLRYAFYEMLAVREGGEGEYGRFDFIQSKGTEHAEEWLGDNLDSINRHIDSYSAGTACDRKSGRHHMAHVAVRAMFAIMYDEHTDMRVKRRNVDLYV